MAENADIQRLKVKRRIAKAGFTRTENFIKSMQPDTVDIDELRIKLDKLAELRKSIEECVIELAVYDIEATDEQIDQQIASYEEKYIGLKLMGERVIKAREKPAAASDSNHLEQVIAGPSPFAYNTRNRTQETHIRLPKIELPNFSGAYEEWHSFFGIFDSLIHSNDSLNNIQKFHYLKSALKGEAAEIIDSLEITDANYRDAWSRLKNRYDNERIAIQNHIKAIFELPVTKRENGNTLRNILDSTLKHTRALAALNRPVNEWDDLLIYIIRSRLDYLTIKEWENSLESKQMLKFKEFVDFLTKRCETLEAVARRSPAIEFNRTRQNFGKVTTVHAAITGVKCAHCKGDHQIYQCREFKELPVADRLSKVKSLRLCLNCLKGKHTVKDCIASTCRKCTKRHSTLLHDDRYSTKDDKEETVKSNREDETNKKDNTICIHAQLTRLKNATQAILSTATVLVKDNKGKYIEGKALLDSGSQSHFVTEEFIKKLGLKTKNDLIKVNGINKQASHALKSVDLHVTSRFGTFSMDMSYIILPNIVENLPTIESRVADWDIPKNIKLADPQFYRSSKIDILLGTEKFWELLCIGQIKLGKNKPIIQKTLLGWVVSGTVDISNSDRNGQTSCNLSTMEILNQTVQKFWEIEGFQNDKKLTSEEKYCEELFNSSYKRQTDGRFIVKYKKEVLPLLNDSREIALKRFLSLERKLSKQPTFKEEYVAFMREYQQLGHMTRVNTNKENKFRVFLPHHAVIKETSTTTKTRVVFDASSQSSQGRSLNDAMYKGPVLQSDLFSLIIQFRCFKYVLCADIEKMYRQILISDEQRALHSILWREDPKEEIQEFELNTVTYGTKSASFLAVRCLIQLAESESDNFPKAAEVIRNQFYMDDLLTGGNTETEIIKLKEDLTKLLAKGGFRLHKWKTNYHKSYENNQSVDSTDSNKDCVDIVKEKESKLLGVLWNPHHDTFHYEITQGDHEPRVTKRVVLSQVCKLFDPLGLVGPVVTSAKILMQELWSLKINWDESIPMHLYKSWCQIRSQLTLLNELRIPRLIISKKNESVIQLHGFCDASQKAYGACVYIRERDKQGNIKVTLICSKSRVAPMKILSLPRLELCGAVLLVNLMSRVLGSLKFELEQRFYWTDSKIVLAWIGSLSRRWHVFVANRVSEIHSNSSPSQWKHVGSKDNPADLISRGTTPEQLINCDIWWNGPHWLRQEVEVWPREGEELLKDIPEEKKQSIVASATNCETIIEYNRFSSLYKLFRVSAYVLRFIYNIRNNKKDRIEGAINAKDLKRAKLTIVKLVQAEEFKEDIRRLKTDNKLQRSSRLISLLPFLDDKGILRVGGRLRHATIPEEAKHPAILPSRHHVTRLLIVHYHEKLFHAGVQTTLNSIREEFWPILARNSVKEIIHKCVQCRKASPKASWQLMGQLPDV
ncbi:uncharacterized protein LOC105202933 [Solenopsis invicta]|uniref:uncharacterized protein LOC105202933 n=1 Tax=Solenopsis invicta TaxID=13686 RepID=UPI00193CBB65|nr:uncharacterized protein LOC105202933 [Solenopsis invicta]